MTEFSIIIKQFLDGNLPLVFGSNHLPDEHLGKIETTEDFLRYISFVVENIDTDKVEYDCHDTSTFLSRVVDYYSAEDVKTHTKEVGIDSDFGFLAYVITLAIGNQ